jgi:hypothetical protein
MLPSPEPTRGIQDMKLCSLAWEMPLLCQGSRLMSRHSPDRDEARLSREGATNQRR